jgi:hypothetical protein
MVPISCNRLTSDIYRIGGYAKTPTLFSLEKTAVVEIVKVEPADAFTDDRHATLARFRRSRSWLCFDPR